MSPDVVETREGYIIFDDITLERLSASAIPLAKPQYAGNARRVVNGIGIVTCVYVNPELDRSWLIAYRIYDKQGDGKMKLNHVADMLKVFVEVRKVAFSTVLMDAWYAAKRLLLYIESLQKTYYCPMKSNRLVDDSGGERPLRHRISEISSTAIMILACFPVVMPAPRICATGVGIHEKRTDIKNSERT